MTRMFDSPGTQGCGICGSAHEAPTLLLPIVGTEEDGIAQAKPVHVDCLRLVWDDRPIGGAPTIIYMVVEEDQLVQGKDQ